ncbi:hypothetical protein E2320_002562 [Naja naja]|nr:hypothetical protein E2320_002562 [Naja naja]
MLKLLKQRKGVTLCPLCNSKVTKRSLKDGIRFKEVIKGTLNVIRAFECDIGLKRSMDFESSSSSQVDKDRIMTQNQSSSHIEHHEPSAKNEASLNIDICGTLEGRKLSRDDTKTINENLEIVEGNVIVKQQPDVSFLDSCMEQPGFNYLRDDSSSSFCRTTQVQLAGEAMNMSTNEQIDNGEKTLIDQSAGNLSVVHENKECQLQSQTMPDICLNKSSGGRRIQIMNQVNEWFSKSEEILSSDSLVSGCSEELPPDSDSSDSEICQPLKKIFIPKSQGILDFDDLLRENMKSDKKEPVRKREDPVLENSDQIFAVVKKSPAEQPEAAFSKIACVGAASMLKGDGDRQAQSECHMLPELNLTDMKNKSNYFNKKSKKIIKPLGKLQVLNKSLMLSEETKEELDIKELRKINQDRMVNRWEKKLLLFKEEDRRRSEATKRKRNVDEREVKQSISLSETMPSCSETEDDFCPSISLQSVTRNEEDGSQPESEKTMDEQRQSPGLEETESSDDCTESLNVWKNTNLYDSGFNHINRSSSGSGHFQDAKSKDTENKKMELNPQTELMQQHSLTSVPLLPGFIHAEKKKQLMEENQVNSDTKKAVDVSSTGEIKNVIPQPNLECSGKEYQYFELLPETPDNLLDPPTKNIKGSPNLWDKTDILAIPAKIDKQTTNGTDLDSKNKCSPMLKSQDFILGYPKFLQKLPSSEEDSSEDEKFSFQALVNVQSTQSHSVKEKEIPVEVLTSNSSSRSGFKYKKVDICQSQESDLSVNLFSSQSNVSMVSGKACNSEDLISFSNSKEKLPSLGGNNEDISPSDKVSIDNEELKCGQEEYAHSESNLGEEMMPYASEATPLEDSLGQFSQSEILTTQQRDAMQNNLKQLQQKMAIIEAALKEGSQNIDPEGWSLEREEADFKREQIETRKEMHTVGEKPVVPLPHTTCCSTKQRNRKRQLLIGKRNMSLVASGLNQSELKLIRKFAKGTESTWCDKITEKTTHVIMKTDEDLVCERTLKYFTGVIHSFEAGRVLEEEDFEVRGDVINGRNHQGPKRARESPVGKLFHGLEICCYGPFTDMLPEQLEWIVELCGASLVKEPHLFTNATNSTAVIVVQPDAWTEENTCQEFPLQCSNVVVSREWVLDSVSCYQCQPFNDYTIPQV